MFEPLSRAECETLASTLGADWPMSVYALRSGTGRGYVRGTLPDYDAAVVEELPRELAGFGEPEPLVALLADVPNWDCVELDQVTAQKVGELWPTPVRFYGSIRYALRQAPRLHPHPSVRRLTIDDLPLLRAAGSDLDIDDPNALVYKGVATGSIIDNRLVSIASSLSITCRYAEVGVVTLPEFRNRGLSTAAAGLLCQDLQARGLTPLWGTGEDNVASQRVAAKLRFTETERRCYVIR